jgi:hypothetical protein
VKGLLVDEDALAIESTNCKPRGLGSGAVADILGGLDAKGVAAEAAGATACPLALGFSA